MIDVLLIEIPLLVTLALCLGVLWSFLQFWTIWAAGDRISSGRIGFLYCIVVWNTWHILDLKIANTPLLIVVLGFGRVLPIVLLVLAGSNILDAAQKAFNDQQP